MEIAIQPNYLMEALYYFERRANGSTLAGVRTALNKSGDSAKIAHAAALAPIIELENRLNESLIVADDIINFYFRDFEDLTSGVSGDNRAMLLFKLFICKSKPLDELIDDMLAMSDREFAYAAVFGMGGRSEVTMTESEASLEDYFEMINTSARSDEVKWYVCQTLMLRRRHLETLRPILNTAVGLIRAEESLYAGLIRNFCADYENSPALIDDITTKLGCRRPHPSAEAEALRPMLFVPVGYDIFAGAGENDTVNNAQLFLGVLSRDYFSENKPILDEGVLPSLAVLCDKTRFLLLQRIASEPAYGPQLAEEFGMTTPNIYHHMGKLVQAKFVNTRIDRNRNYYSINKNYINQLLDELKGILRC